MIPLSPPIQSMQDWVTSSATPNPEITLYATTSASTAADCKACPADKPQN